VELHWLEKDYEAVLRDFKTHEAMFELPAHSWRNPYRVRALVKVGRYAEALAAAEKLEQNAHVPFLTMLVHAAKGDVERVMEIARARIANDFDVADCYRNEDLGPLLRDARFAPFRERFPEPKTGNVVDID
jgi:hypothetical protein